MSLLENVNGTEPRAGEVWPIFFRLTNRMHSKAMATGRIIVELGRNLGVHESTIVNERIFPVVFVVFGLNEEGWRRETVGLVSRIECDLIGWNAEVGGVSDDGEIRSGADRFVCFRGGRGGMDVLVVGMGAK